MFALAIFEDVNVLASEMGDVAALASTFRDVNVIVGHISRRRCGGG